MARGSPASFLLPFFFSFSLCIRQCFHLSGIRGEGLATEPRALHRQGPLCSCESHPHFHFCDLEAVPVGSQGPKPVTSISLYHSPDQEAMKGRPGEAFVRSLVIFGSNNGYNIPLGGSLAKLLWPLGHTGGEVPRMHLQTMKPESPTM